MYSSIAKRQPFFAMVTGVLYHENVFDPITEILPLFTEVVMRARWLAVRPARKLGAIAILSVFMIHTLAPPVMAEQFQKVGLIVAGAEKAQEVDVILSLEENRLAIRTKDSLNDLKVLPYKEIKAAEYSFSKHPRWKSGGAAAVAAGVFALPIFFLKGKRHWLTIRTSNDYAVLRLDKNDYRLILVAFETRTGLKVEVVPEEK